MRPALFPVRSPSPVAGTASRRFRAAFASIGLVIGLGAALPLAGCIGGSAPATLQTASPMQVDESTTLAAVNAFRASQGMKPVKLSASLSAAARSQAMDMAAHDTMSHNLGGQTLPKRLAKAGYGWQVADENIGEGYPTMAAAMLGWKNSPGHRKNLLDPGVTEIGIGAAEVSRSRYHYYWSLILAAPDQRRVTVIGAGS
ncbi:Uncharacterized conserved protein YkwD, contains CAP (CSP/antigen 5/PR1) domain [Faunimonas pinastri]|uniref:Uncharacterized conserved protein YkwD, contains CAP (CSP/antigen 5/PR1) domain n=1 Tax=Faunimonas pinastri TaxID=1855383 RepID=A0A1H9HJX7_9HYPH|nr:CAP domain-containing protein [Faunimonas pinastri]SEQ62634.1 Uncharacterized conserved protein YkwD, contains CAP (CSP/antigen 5/PR1) domain [Faunimonas pinastri]